MNRRAVAIGTILCGGALIVFLSSRGHGPDQGGGHDLGDAPRGERARPVETPAVPILRGTEAESGASLPQGIVETPAQIEWRVTAHLSRLGARPSVSVKWMLFSGGDLRSRPIVSQQESAVVDNAADIDLRGKESGTLFASALGLQLTPPSGVRVRGGDRVDLGEIDASILPIAGRVEGADGVGVGGVTITYPAQAGASETTLVSGENGRFHLRSAAIRSILLGTQETAEFLALAPQVFAMDEDRQVVIRIERKPRISIRCVSASTGIPFSFPVTAWVQRQVGDEIEHRIQSLHDGPLYLSPGTYRVSATVDSSVGAFRSDPTPVTLDAGSETDLVLQCRPKGSAGLLVLRVVGPGGQMPEDAEGRLLLAHSSERPPRFRTVIPEGLRVRGGLLTCPIDAGEYRLRVAYRTGDVIAGADVLFGTITVGHEEHAEVSTSLWGAIEIPSADLLRMRDLSVSSAQPDSVNAIVENQGSWRFARGAVLDLPTAGALRVWVPGGQYTFRATLGETQWERTSEVVPGRVTPLLRGE